jgi:hypothetical protein
VVRLTCLAAEPGCEGVVDIGLCRKKKYRHGNPVEEVRRKMPSESPIIIACSRSMQG